MLASDKLAFGITNKSELSAPDWDVLRKFADEVLERKYNFDEE